MTSPQPRPQNSFKVFLSIFSGEEKEYVRNSEPKARIMFALIGSFVIAMFAGCISSAYFFFDSLMDGNKLVSIPMGVFWGLLVVNMYLLLLYTVSPSILPHKKRSAGSDNGLFTFSMSLRVGFMWLLAVIIAQPLNERTFSTSIEQSLRRHVQEEKAKMIVSSDAYIISQQIQDFRDFDARLSATLPPDEYECVRHHLSVIGKKISRDSLFIKAAALKLDRVLKIEAKMFPTKKEQNEQILLLEKLNSMIDWEISSDETLRSSLDSTFIAHAEFAAYKSTLCGALDAKLKNHADLERMLSRTNFYIRKIQLIFYENPFSWMLTGFICALFILPIILKYQVRRLTGYYRNRIVMEKQDVEKRYDDFKKIYSRLLRENVARYNFSSMRRLDEELARLKEIKPKRHRKLKKEIEEEYRDEVFSKYEHWADNPFRTVRKNKPRLITKPAAALMDFLYKSPETETE